MERLFGSLESLLEHIQSLRVNFECWNHVEMHFWADFSKKAMEIAGHQN